MTATGYISVGVAGPKGDDGDPGPPGADSTVPGPQGAPGADGADGHVPVVRQQYVTDRGRITLPDTSGVWLPLADFPTLSVPAAVGDYVEATYQALKNPPAAGLDMAVLVGGAIVRFLTSGGATPGGDGDAGWQAPGDYLGRPSPHGFVVEAGDLTAGSVVFCIAVKAAGTGTMDAQTAFPFYWRAVNYGVVS